MKTARMKALLVAVYCPTCNEAVMNPATSSYDWEPTHIVAGKAMKCEQCLFPFRLGKKADA